MELPAVEGLYDPARHWMHGYEVAFAVGLYVPTGQALHWMGFASVETPMV